jgi:hypothetical protein
VRLQENIMANHIVKIGVSAPNAQMRLALSSGIAMSALAAIAMNASWFTACAQDLPNPQPIAQVIAPTATSPATDSATAAGHTSPGNGENHRLFFGYVEFDWDPNAPGGVPGFGPLPDTHRVANR